MPPPTIIVVHPKERTKKCTVAPLRGREGFVFWKFPKRGPEPLDDYVRLGLGGPLLSPDDADRGLLVLDGTWKWAEKMERDFADLPVRSLPAGKTAYPRISKLYDDPDAGLATIEAIYAAYTHLGRSTEGLLDDYRWADEFLALNKERTRNVDSDRDRILRHAGTMKDDPDLELMLKKIYEERGRSMTEDPE